MSIFERRHYNWLAQFAAAELQEREQQALIRELSSENSRFKPARFTAAVNKARANGGTNHEAR